MKQHNIILPCLLSLVMNSCADNETLNIENGSKSQVLFSVDDFITEYQTRTNCDPNNNYKITWASGDAIGIFPREGDQEPFVIPVEQVGQSTAAFDGGYWALKAGKTYNAYYPFSRENYASSDMKTKIPVTYLGQYQNGRECSVGSYDYTYSDWKESVGGASVSFSFHHLGSFLVLKLPIPANATYTSLTLNAGSAVIPTTGTYDLTATKPAFVSKTKASSLSMQLNSFTGVAGENATFYMMVPPMDLSAETLTVTLSTGSTSCTYSIESKNISAARLYNLTGTPVSSTVTGTVDEWLPAQNMHNGHEYVDLGLPSGLKWATMNVGATTPEGYGDYFAWGETEPYYTAGHAYDTPCSNWKTGKTGYNWTNYKWCNGSWDTLTKYSNNSSYGTIDNKTLLEPADDAAHQNWGGLWRIPTQADFQELREKCTWEWSTQNNVYGYKVTGSNSNWIFLPVAGVRSDAGLGRGGSYGCYWSSMLYQEFPGYAYYLNFYNNYIYPNFKTDRYNGHSVRPVTE